MYKIFFKKNNLCEEYKKKRPRIAKWWFFHSFILTEFCSFLGESSLSSSSFSPIFASRSRPRFTFLFFFFCKSFSFLYFSFEWKKKTTMPNIKKEKEKRLLYFSFHVFACIFRIYIWRKKQEEDEENQENIHEKKTRRSFNCGCFSGRVYDDDDDFLPLHGNKKQAKWKICFSHKAKNKKIKKNLNEIKKQREIKKNSHICECLVNIASLLHITQSKKKREIGKFISFRMLLICVLYIYLYNRKKGIYKTARWDRVF